ncbi:MULTISPECIES: dihydrodipicolinate synthase family protein [unclassified Microbacterium]|uniref:dihydrodipicolinate synthase family protein n=1 Tax=unclassified Microbacterium TaxID=2609290 RepID=UPI0012FAEF75|nr:dihydrodipicolinate synthase family protein [Microbacterium sp. MAH-37]MVQ44086.1 N-acetylneuraminate lyase [Microbacterium sp. MAH-37]
MTLEIWAAVPTPYDDGGELALGQVAAQAERLAADGVDGVFVGGTTGEFPFLSVGERRALAEAWVQARGGLRLGVHVGATDVRDAAALAGHAESVGADLVSTVAPYYGPIGLTGTVDFFETVAAAAPGTPFCIYHFPGMTGSRVPIVDIVAAARTRIPTLSSVKFTDEDLSAFAAVRASGVEAYFGRDELLPAALAMGADRVIGSLYNLLAPQARRVHDAVAAGRLEEAFALHEPFRRIAVAAGRHGGPAFVKALISAQGPDLGATRMPWGPLTEEDAAAVVALG